MKLADTNVWLALVISKRVFHAYLATFLIAGRHQLVTTDQAFTQYTGLDLLVLPMPLRIGWTRKHWMDGEIKGADTRRRWRTHACLPISLPSLNPPE